MTETDDPPVREFADRGLIWLLESRENMRALLELAAEGIADRLDFSRAERINRSFVPTDLHKEEADLLYRVPFMESEHAVWVYLLVEHQKRPDRSMGLRLLSYMVHVWDSERRAWRDNKTPDRERRLHPIVPIVLYTGKRRWTNSLGVEVLMEVPEPLRIFVPRHETLFLKLHEMTATELSRSPLGLALRGLQASGEPKEALSRVLAEVVKQLGSFSDEAKAEWA